VESEKSDISAFSRSRRSAGLTRFEPVLAENTLSLTYIWNVREVWRKIQILDKSFGFKGKDRGVFKPNGITRETRRPWVFHNRVFRSGQKTSLRMKGATRVRNRVINGSSRYQQTCITHTRISS